MVVIISQGTRLILNLRDVALTGGIDSTFDVTLELRAVQNPRPEPSPVASMTGPVPETATSATVISVA